MQRPLLAAVFGLVLNVLAGVSLLLAVAVAALGWRSYAQPEHFWVCYRSGTIDSIKTDRGELTLARRRTPFAVRRMTFFHEAGPGVRARLTRGSYAVERRWGPFAYAVAPPAPPPSAEQLREVDALSREAFAFDAVPPPEAEQDAADWARRRWLAYRAAQNAQWRLNASKISLRLVVLPCWSLLPPLLVLPAVRALVLRRAARRRLRGDARVCPGCGCELPAGAERCDGCAAAARPEVPAAAGAAPPSALAGVTPGALPYTDRRDLAARIAAYRVDRGQHRRPPQRPRPTP